ncbi:MAG TPA: hypothetical protein GX707_02935 [Epulopiscium sp.]|nr:hypothetical protein [Candidatus Epulonipiscium sp.]
MILNDNLNMDHVTTKLNLPTTYENYPLYIPAEQSIEWWVNNPKYVDKFGNVFRPTGPEGDRPVTLTATIKCGSFFRQKDFKVTVKADNVQDDEAVNETYRWLETYRAIHENTISNTITEDLFCPTEGLHGSSVIWSSDKPDIITNEGSVNRPEFEAGSDTVILTATITKGEFTKLLYFEYLVLRKPNMAPPIVTRTSPANDSTGVSWDINRITIDFDNKIILSTFDGGYRVIPTVNDLGGKQVTMQFADPLPPSTTFAISIDRDVVRDEFNNTNSPAYIQFKTRGGSPAKIESVYPADGETDVSINPNIEVAFSDLLKLKTYDFKLTDSLENDCPLYAPYTLEVPRGVVKNLSGATQERSYKFEFTTVGEYKEEEEEKEEEEDKEEEKEEDKDKEEDKEEDKDKEDRYEKEDTNYQPPSKTYKAYLSFGKLGKTLEIQEKDGKALVKLNIQDLDIFKENKNVTLNIPDIPGLESYTLEMPGGIFGLGGSSLSLHTGFGNLDIPYQAKASELENPESIIIWYIDKDGNTTIILNSYYDPEGNSVNFTTTHFGNFGVVYNKVNFNDVKDNAWYYKAVSFMAAREITSGTGDGKFSPNNNLTRGEFITMMMRAYDIKVDTDPKDNFADGGNTWYTAYLGAAKSLGISQGIGNNMFGPDKQITRQEMFTLVYNTLEIINQLPEKKEEGPRKSLSHFTDYHEINSWAKDAMTLMIESGTIQGSGGKLSPKDKTTRAEMAQILYNLTILKTLGSDPKDQQSNLLVFGKGFAGKCVIR